MYSVKKLTFEQVVDVDVDIFSTTVVPTPLLQVQNVLVSGGSVVVNGGGGSTTINAATMSYLTNLSDRTATYSSSTTVTVTAFAAINPVTLVAATINEFDIYINGQYIDKSVYTWTPAESATQTIVFDTNALGFTLNSGMVVIVNGRWA